MAHLGHQPRAFMELGARRCFLLAGAGTDMWLRLRRRLVGLASGLGATSSAISLPRCWAIPLAHNPCARACLMGNVLGIGGAGIEAGGLVAAAQTAAMTGGSVAAVFAPLVVAVTAATATITAIVTGMLLK